MKHPPQQPEHTDRLAQLIAAKRQVLEQVRILTEKQLEIIASGNATSLMRVLNAKERLIVNWQKLETQLEPYREEDPEARVWRTPQDRVRCGADVDECQLIIKNIVAMEEKGLGEMVEKRGRVSTQIHDAHNAARARSAYMTDAAKQNRLDLTSE